MEIKSLGKSNEFSKEEIQIMYNWLCSIYWDAESNNGLIDVDSYDRKILKTLLKL